MQNKEYPIKELKEQKQIWWMPAVALFAKFSGWIIFPLVIGLTLGSWLDEKYKSKPLFFLITIGVSFFISMFGIVKNTLTEYKKIEKEANNEKIKNKK